MSPTAMSAIPPRCLRCSGSASRCGRSTPCSSPTTPAMRRRAAAPSTPRISASWCRGCASAACCATATACCRAMSARPRSARAILDAVAEVKRANPRALYCCDPVIGDVGRGAFVQPEVADFMRAARGAGRRHRDAEPLRAGAAHRPHGPQPRRRAGRDRRAAQRSARAIVLVTSLVTDETPADAIDLVACDDDRPLSPAHAEAAGRGARRGRRHRGAVPGALSAHRLGGRGDVARGGVGVRHPQAHRGGGRREMALIEAQDEMVNPSASFAAEPL